MFRATFGKPDRSDAQHYYQTAYRRRTQAHRRGWLNAIQIRAVRMGPLGALFYFPKQRTRRPMPQRSRKQSMSSNSHDPNQMTGAAMIVRALIDHGVKHLFGYPGGAVLPIYDEIFQQSEVEHILVRHEQGAGHAAEGYARSTGKPGVVLVTSGPGATNMVT